MEELNFPIAEGRCKLERELKPEEQREAMSAAAAWDARDRNPTPPRLRLSWACNRVVSTAVHREKYWQTSMSKSSEALMDREGGVAHARWAILHKELHSHRRTKATSSSLHSSVLALPHLFEMKLVQYQ